MNKRERLQLLITGKTPKILEGFKAFDSGVAELKKNLEETIRVSTLDEVGAKLNALQKKVDFTAIESAIKNLKAEIEDRDVAERKDLETKLTSLKNELATADANNTTSIKSTNEEIQTIQTQIVEILARKPIEIPDFTPQIIKVENSLRTLITNNADQDKADDKEVQNQITDIEETIKKVRLELIDRLNNKGGGNMNRQIFIGGVDFLKKYTDYNIKAGSNITITYADNNVTKKVDVTISSTGGGGGSTRSISNVNADTTAGSASGTDYVYLCSGTMTLTLPTAVGNTNLYTIKNTGSGIITVACFGAETIDGATTQIMPVQFTSIDVISNTAAWAIT